MDVSSKKILVLSMFFGDNAAGIVFKRIVNKLAENYSIDLVTAAEQKSEESFGLQVKSVPYLKWPNVIIKTLLRLRLLYNDGIPYLRITLRSILVRLFGYNPLDKFWANRVIKIVGETADYPVIVVLQSEGLYGPLIASTLMKNKYNSKVMMYSVDPLPTTRGWAKSIKTRDIDIIALKELFSRVDTVFFSNEVMLEYDIKLFEFKNINEVGVIYTPSLFNSLQSFPVIQSEFFLYTGNFYGARKATKLLLAFRKLLTFYPNAKLLLVGTAKLNYMVNLLSGIEDSVEFIPRTNNLIPYYEKSCCLIDVDSEQPDDPYLSSKLTNYLMINRPIISETNNGSASHRLFHDFETIRVCGHDADELFEAMKYVLESHSWNYIERDEIIKQFSINYASQTMKNAIESLS